MKENPFFRFLQYINNLVSQFWLPAGGIEGFGPQIRVQRVEISPGTDSEVVILELEWFPRGSMFLMFNVKNET